MDFKTVLVQYIETLECSSKELSELSGLSKSTLSKYRSGERIPKRNDESISKLADSISTIAVNKGIENCTYNEVFANLQSSLTPEFDSKAFAQKFDYLIRTLNINVSHMSNSLGYDASFLSRVRTDARVPGNIIDFIQKLCFYLIKKCEGQHTTETLLHIIQLEYDTIPDSKVVLEQLQHWLTDSSYKSKSHVDHFMQKIDEFDLVDYIHAVHFDELKVPSVPFQLPTTKDFYGIEGQKKSELLFFKGTVLSKSKGPVFMCVDMDMSDMVDDSDFSKKWMFGLAMILKREMNIQMIHNLNRPFHELMLGLEAWIPLYMTGYVIPFYLNGTQNSIYQHLLYVSASYALSGEAIKGFHNQGKWHLTNSKNEIDYYKKRSKSLAKKALPLMKIYTLNDAASFELFSSNAILEKGNYHCISSSLPLFTLDDSLLENILTKNKIYGSEAEKLFAFVKEQKEKYESLLNVRSIQYEVQNLSYEEFSKYPLALNFSEIFCSKTILYDFEDYTLHLQKTREYAQSHPKMSLFENVHTAFHNIQINILEGKWVWISKLKSPTIHFVIYHSKLRNAIENMYIPVLK